MAPGSAFAGKPAEIKDLRYSSTKSYTRVVLELTYSTGFSVNRLRNPDRLYIDLKDSMIMPEAERSMKVGDGLLGSVRYAQFDSRTVRVVMEMEPGNTYKVFRLEGPPRIVVDFFRKASGQDVIKDSPVQAPVQESSDTMMLARKKLRELERRKAELKARIEAQESSGLDNAMASKALADARIAREAEDRRVEEAKRAEKERQATIAAEKVRKEAEAEQIRREEVRKLAEARAKALARSSREKPVASLPVLKKAPKTAWSPPKPARSGNSARSERKTGRFKRYRIVVDAGHGGKDPGAIARGGLQEKTIVLDIAKRLKRKLEAMGGYEVILTRNRDRYLELEERARIANRKDADIFVSIHANASRNKRSRGLETYYLNRTSDDDTIKIAARENAIPIEKMRKAIDMTNNDYLLASLAMQRKQYESGRLAKIVREKMYSAVRSRYHGVTTKKSKWGPFYVLYGARMPAVLVEVSYLTNRTEASRLGTSTYRDYLAGGIAAGIRDYINSIPAAANLAKR
jgi:N-acetylmuramoyl-L-alanine amidase